MFTLTISPSGGSVRVSEHGNLRDARAALAGHQQRRGLWITAARWVERDGRAVQDGQLMSGSAALGDWAISYPVGLDTYAVSV